MSKTIVLLRHAEEPVDSDSADLSPAGQARAQKLAAFVPKAFGKPDFLFAAAPADSSARAFLTLRPLAHALGKSIDTSYKAREFALLGSKLMHDPLFDNARIVVCWTHTELPSFASCLLVRRAQFPTQWGEKVFDDLFELTYRKAPRPKVRRVVQP